MRRLLRIARGIVIRSRIGWRGVLFRIIRRLLGVMDRDLMYFLTLVMRVFFLEGLVFWDRCACVRRRLGYLSCVVSYAVRLVNGMVDVLERIFWIVMVRIDDFLFLVMNL